MSGVTTVAVTESDGELRLDRWFRRRFPKLPHGRLQKLLRTGQVRVDGRRAQASQRVAPGQTIRVPPFQLDDAKRATPKAPGIRPEDAEELRAMILYEDDALIVLNKSPGLAVQGGTRTTRHIDGMLEALVVDGERPRLVHRLDRDTSGLLVVARTAQSAAYMTSAFRRHEVTKLYWALVMGRPPAAEGVIDTPLGKSGGPGRERMGADDAGKAARTRYRVVARAGKVAAWMALQPLTGRTHQLRVHCAGLGCPILGDGKYGGEAARPAGAPEGLMLHARALRLRHPDGRTLDLEAPMPGQLRKGLAWLGFPEEPLAGSRLADWTER